MRDLLRETKKFNPQVKTQAFEKKCLSFFMPIYLGVKSQQALGGFILKTLSVHSALDNDIASIIAFGWKDKTDWTNGDRIPAGAPTSAILLSDTDVYIVKSLCF